MFKHRGWILVFAVMTLAFPGCGTGGGGSGGGSSTPPAPTTLAGKYEGIYRIPGSGFDITIRATTDTDGSVSIHFNGPAWDDVLFYRIEGSGAMSTGGRTVYLFTTSGVKQLRINSTTYQLTYISG